MIHLGDLFDVLPTLDAESIDACVTDPPYDLTANKRGGSGAASLNLNSPAGRSRITTGGGFMGKEWDGTGVAFNPETWREVYRVLKPGAHLLAFGGTRTFHRMTCAIEDAGFEIRDCLSWLHGQGFPKSLNLGDGRGTALKPSWEPIILARKPLKGTVAANVAQYGTGAINIDACRIAMSQEDREFILKTARPNSAGQEHIGAVMNRPPSPTVNVHDAGRWPANVLLDDQSAALLDEQTGESVSGQPRSDRGSGGIWSAGNGVPCGPQYGDFGGASRFYYVAKPSREERDNGCEGLPARSGGEATDRQGSRNVHPTVKPVELMRWLVCLVTPPDGVVLDPFTGSGTTGMACRYEQRRFIGIEREAEYVAIAERRIGAVAPLFGEASA